MLKNSKLKTAIVTGGSKGIGLRIALILAKKKFNVVICSRNLRDAIKAKKQIKSLGVKCLALRADVSNFNHCKSLVKKTIEIFSKVDLLVNNAGIQGPIGKLWQNNLKEWEKTLQVNLLGTFYMCHLVIPYMLKQKSGIIINLSGGGSAYARPNFSAYACSKTAVLRLTETLSSELSGKNIKVFALAPGIVWTDMAKEALVKGKEVLDDRSISELTKAKETGGTQINKLENLVNLFLSKDSKDLSGRLVHVNELDKIIKNNSRIKAESGLLRRVDYN